MNRVGRKRNLWEEDTVLMLNAVVDKFTKNYLPESIRTNFVTFVKDAITATIVIIFARSASKYTSSTRTVIYHNGNNATFAIEE